MKEKHCKNYECVKTSAYKKNLMRLNIKHIDLFGGGMQDFPNLLEGLRAHCEARFIPE